MVIAYQKFNDINSLSDSVEKHREWLKDYEGKKYSKGINGIDLIKWKNTKYSIKEFSTDINKIGGLPNRLIIEFDDHDSNGEKNKDKIKENIIKSKEILKKNNWGYIESTHQGASNYLWIEFTRDLETNEKKSFLKWFASQIGNCEIDLNFASSNFCFPVLFAIHWKHSNYRETPIEYFIGNKIDYDTLKNAFKEKTIKGKYETYRVFSRTGQVEIFYQNQPFFYDRTGLWWFWDFELFCWKIIDEVDILNSIAKTTGLDIISSKSRNEILNTLKQFGRQMIPKEISPTWIQFKDEIYDIKTGERFISSPDYFVTNPIPFKVNGNPNTPVMDRIFKEWVGEDYIRTLYEIIAYCCLCDYPINRLFCFIGSGMNGKSCFLNLLRKFVGTSNVCTTELDLLLTSRFEVTKLHKKLVCMLGETNFNEMKNTSIIKRLTGGDLIGFEYKNKNPFEDRNYAKMIIATNNLPTTNDKTIGFYRRWMIVDFPNEFTEKKDILSEIPEEEYDNLATKSVLILNDLLRNREFSKEGTVDERMKKFEEKSNPIGKFIKEFCILDNPNDFITSSQFEKRFSEWCKENRYRDFSSESIAKQLKNLGLEHGKSYIDWWELGSCTKKQVKGWFGIRWKE